MSIKAAPKGAMTPQRPRYTAEDLQGAAASLAIEGLMVTEEDTQEALAVLNGEVTWEQYLQSLHDRFTPPAPPPSRPQTPRPGNP